MTTLTPPGDNATPRRDDAPAYIPSKSPGRIAVDGITVQLLKMYGLHPEDIPRGPGGTSRVTIDETVAELERRGYTVERVWERPPLPEREVRPRLAALIDLGMHLLKVIPWTKTPAHFDWPNMSPLTLEESVEWVSGEGGNVAINMLHSGTNGLWGLDSECWDVTQKLIAAGLAPTVVTANGRNLDPSNKKRGGAHVLGPLPAGLDPSTLHSRLCIEIPGCGMVDVLQGTRFAMAPCSRLITSPDHMYDFAGKYPNAETGGPLTGYAADGSPILDLNLWTPPPAWLTDEAVPPPLPGLEPLQAMIAPPKPKVKRQPNPNSDAITQQVEDLDWASDVVAGDPRIQWTGTFAGCSCPQFHFVGADNPCSGNFHETCAEYGDAYHLYSGTAMHVLGLPDHGSKWTFAAALRGRSLADTARELGIDMGGFAAAAEVNPFPVPPPPARKSSVPRIGNASSVSYLFGEPPAAIGTDADSHTPAGDPAEGAKATVAGTDFDVDDEELDADEEPLPPKARAVLQKLRAEIKVREDQLAMMTPGLGRVHRNARRAGVYMHGLTVALMVRTVVNIPPYVLLPDGAGLTLSKELGSAINHNGLLVGPSATGKTRTVKIARALLRLTFGVISISDGTAEGMCKKARSADKGKTVIHATGVLVETDEFTSVVMEMERPGSKFDTFTRKVWTGEPSGSTASDKNRDAQLPEHSTRMCFLFGAQPHSLEPLLARSDLGTPQRYEFGLVGVVKRADRDPELYGDRNFEPILENQDQLPWVQTGIPPGYAPRNSTPEVDTADAADTTTAEEQEEEKREGLIGFDDAEPVWIGIPAEVRELMDEEADRAARRSEDWVLAIAEDAAGISGHNIPLQLRDAFAIATWDGHSDIELQHWKAAALLIEMRQLVQDASALVAKHKRGVAITEEGEEQGLRQEVAEATRAERRSLRHRNCERRLFDLIDAATGLYPDLFEVAANAMARVPEIFKDGGLNMTPRPGSKTGASRIEGVLNAGQRKALPAVLADLRKRQAITGDTVIYRAGAETTNSGATTTAVTKGTFRVPPAGATA